MPENKKGAPKPPDVTEIDLSKAKNFEAASKADPSLTELAEKSKTTSRKRKTGKFNFSSAEAIPLPSGGKLYKGVTDDEDVIKHGHIRMLPMTIKEEEILSTQKFLKAGIATRMILDSCIDSDIDAKDILLFDSNFLMFYLRSISYGDEYTFNIQCTNPSCEKKFEHTVLISELPFEELSNDIKEPIKIKLPKSGYTVEAILPRLYHSEEIYMRNRNKRKGTGDKDERLVDNLLVTTIRIIDNDGNEVPEEDWQEFYESIPGIDSGTLREKTTFSTGVDEISDIECPYCQQEYSGTIPIGPEFFRF